MLRPFLAWRPLRTLSPLQLLGLAALALSTALRAGPRAFGREHSSLAHTVAGMPNQPEQ
jgi:hypothetical protein